MKILQITLSLNCSASSDINMSATTTAIAVLCYLYTIHLVRCIFVREIAVLHSGTMRFFGDWFGRPMDNYHKAINASYDKDSDVLVLTFDGGEQCKVYSPVDITTHINPKGLYNQGSVCDRENNFTFSKKDFRKHIFKFLYMRGQFQKLPPIANQKYREVLIS
jgi:hypothetical protein